jgi:flagellar L-ring protein precursor FlgH
MLEKISRALALVLSLALFAGVARAQTAATPAGQDNQNNSSDLAASSLPIGTLTERAGGSLARATLDARTDTTSSTPLSAASYCAVQDAAPKLLHKHDLVTIIVNEQSAYSTQGETDQEKTADFDAQIADYIHYDPDGNQLTPEQPSNPLEFNATGTRDLKGTGKVDRQDSVTARITAEVIDVKPNGTLVLQATESIKTDDELQQLSLTGTCRVDDITPDNNVLSTQLFDLHLTKVHKGQVRDTTKRGLFPRLLDWIDPF